MRVTSLTITILLLVFAPGCGYQIGSIMHPQVKTIAVAPVVNETLSYNASAEVRGSLCEAFMADGSLKLVDMSKADCIVYAKILDVKYSVVSWTTQSNDFDTPNQWRVSMTIEFSVVIPGQAKPLLSVRSVSGSAFFQTGADQEMSQHNGTKQAAFDAAQKVVAGITEAW